MQIRKRYDRHLDLGNNSSLEITGAITVEAWVKYTASVPVPSTTFPTVISNLNSAGTNGYSLLLHGDDGGGQANNLYLSTIASGVEKVITEGAIAVQNNVYYLAGTYDTVASGNNAHLYTNTGVRNSAFGTNALGASTQNVSVSNIAIGALTGFWNGYIDELRISAVARSQDWLQTGYNNANDPNTFYTIGNEVQIGAGGGLRIYVFR